MCLGIPGKITQIYITNGLRMGKIAFGDVTREACLEYLPEAKEGDYTIIHAGFAISLLDEEQAQESLEMISEMLLFEEEQANDQKSSALG